MTPMDRPRFDATQGPRVIGPADGEALDLVALGVRFIVWGAESGGGCPRRCHATAAASAS